MIKTCSSAFDYPKKKKFDKIKPISGVFISDTQIAEIFKTVIHAPMESLVLENLNYNKTIGNFFFALSLPINFIYH